jgi:hypothetical protein
MRSTKTLMLAGLCLISAGLTAGAFEGKISYQLTDAKGVNHALTLSQSGGKLRMDFSAKGFSGASIVDPEAHTSTMLLDSRKAYMVTHFDPAAAKAKGGSTITKSGRSDRILGYAVEEWVSEREGKKTSLWLTDELGRGFFQPSSSRGVPDMSIPAELREKGFLPLKIVTSTGATILATRVVPGTLDASLFKVPEGYTEMQGMDGAGGGGAAAGGDPAQGSASGLPAGMPADAQARIEQAMQAMSPEQKAAMMKAMQGQGGN